MSDDIGGMGPVDGGGHVRRTRFLDGEPLPPEVVAAGLDHPDGLGVRRPQGEAR